MHLDNGALRTVSDRFRRAYTYDVRLQDVWDCRRHEAGALSLVLTPWDVNYASMALRIGRQNPSLSCAFRPKYNPILRVPVVLRCANVDKSLIFQGTKYNLIPRPTVANAYKIAIAGQLLLHNDK
jgi:hypothetical protein